MRKAYNSNILRSRTEMNVLNICAYEWKESHKYWGNIENMVKTAGVDGVTENTLKVWMWLACGKTMWLTYYICEACISN